MLEVGTLSIRKFQDCHNTFDGTHKLQSHSFHSIPFCVLSLKNVQNEGISEKSYIILRLNI
jgi:hypothetical protein